MAAQDGRLPSLFVPDQGLGEVAGDGEPRAVPRARGRTFDVTYYCLWAMAWNDAPAVPDRILWQITLAPDGKSFTGILFYQPFVDGEYVDFGWGELVATRLGVVPIP